MKKIISRKKFIKNISYLTLGMVGFTNFILSSTKTMNSLGQHLSLEHGSDGILKILKGFKYTIISKKGQIMSDGLQVPDHADGMTAFQAKKKKIILIRNHEISRFLKNFKKSRKIIFPSNIEFRDHYVRGYGQGFRDHISTFRHRKTCIWCPSRTSDCQKIAHKRRILEENQAFS